MKLILRPFRTMLVVAVCSVAFIPALARANIQTIRNANSAYWLSVGAAQLDYKEASSPVANTQSGWIPSVALGASYMGSSNGLYVGVEGSVSAGDDTYSGAYRATTDAVIVRANIKAGKGFILADSLMLTPYVDLGYRHWERDTGANQQQDFDNMEVLGGAMLQFSPTEKVVLTAYGAAGAVLSGQMKTTGGDYKLGNGGLYKFGGKIGYTISDHLELFTSLDFDHFQFARSEIVNNAYRPSSVTDDAAIRVGIAYQFMKK